MQSSSLVANSVVAVVEPSVHGMREEPPEQKKFRPHGKLEANPTNTAPATRQAILHGFYKPSLTRAPPIVR